MTRKIALSIVLIVLLFGCYELFFGEQPFIREKISSIRELESSSKRLETASLELERNSTTDFENKKAQLKKVIQTYNDTKEEYEQIIPPSVENPTEPIVGSELKDIYDVAFLWTILGNYATEEGIDLKFDIIKNFTSANSINNTSSNYIVCDLKFVITGQYINLTDFIYDIEDDDRLNFEINDFTMKKNEDKLQVTLNVRDIKVNASSLSELNSTTTSKAEDEGEIMNTTNTANTTNTTNTANSNAVNNTIQ